MHRAFQADKQPLREVVLLTDFVMCRKLAGNHEKGREGDCVSSGI
jgi:hypothetical protein